MTAKQVVLSKFPDATIRRCESALYRGIEFRVSWGKDNKGNFKQTIGRSPSEAWVKAKNLIEEK